MDMGSGSIKRDGVLVEGILRRDLDATTIGFLILFYYANQKRDGIDRRVVLWSS